MQQFVVVSFIPPYSVEVLNMTTTPNELFAKVARSYLAKGKSYDEAGRIARAVVRRQAQYCHPNTTFAPIGELGVVA